MHADVDIPIVNDHILKTKEARLINNLLESIKILKRQNQLANQVIQSVRFCLNEQDLRSPRSVVGSNIMVRESLRVFESEMDSMAGGRTKPAPDAASTRDSAASADDPDRGGGAASERELLRVHWAMLRLENGRRERDQLRRASDSSRSRST